MIRKGVAISILLTMTFSLLTPITLKAKEYNSEEILTARTSSIQQIYDVAESNIKAEIIKKKELEAKNLRNQIDKEYKDLMLQLHTTKNRKEWMKKYNALLAKYEQLNSKKHITNKYSQQEIALMQRCVETEVHGGDFNSKANVASVILNRVNDKQDRFGGSITEVITSKNQFAYSKTKITEETKLAVEFAYMKDTTNNCLWFHSYKKAGKFYGTYQFTDAVGHHFYK